MKRMFAALLAAVMLTLCGCSTVVLGNGTMDVDANAVDHIVITNGRTGKTFSVADRETINTVVSHINSFDLTDPQEPWNGNAYNLNLVDSKGENLLYVAVDEGAVTVDRAMYQLNAKDLLQYVEGLECDTLTDNELIDSLLDSGTLDRLNIMDDEGKISLDRIVSLPKTCPALFELLSRPSAITAVGTYGSEKIESFLNSNNPELVETAKEWIEILKQLIPEAKENLENLIETYKNSENNP